MMHIFLLLLFALALFSGLFGRLLSLVIRIAFLLILAGLLIHP
jgi:hypothetical protein